MMSMPKDYNRITGYMSDNQLPTENEENNTDFSSHMLIASSKFAN